MESSTPAPPVTEDSARLAKPFWRFSLKTLLGITCVACLFVAPIPWLGGMYVLSLVISTLMLALVLRGVRKKQTGRPVIACGLPVLTIFLGFVSPVALLQAAGTAGMLLLTIPWQDRVKIRAAACVGVMVFFYCVMLLQARSSDLHIEALRAKYTHVSLEDRLAPLTPLEQTSQASADPDRQDVQPRRRWSSRQRSLHTLHNGAKRHFISSAGFGIVRMATFHEPSLEVPERLRESPDILTPQGLAPAEAYPLIHSNLSLRFFDADMFGDVDAEGRVAGFEPHALREEESYRSTPSDPATWRIDRLELVGVLRHEEPAVYVLEGLPSMDQVADAPTRPLDEFESAALAKLLAGSDLEHEEASPGIRMLGALRAEPECLQCHQANQGDLLGAFSYNVSQVDLLAADDAP